MEKVQEMVHQALHHDDQNLNLTTVGSHFELKDDHEITTDDGSWDVETLRSKVTRDGTRLSNYKGQI